MSNSALSRDPDSNPPPHSAPAEPGSADKHAGIGANGHSYARFRDIGLQVQADSRSIAGSSPQRAATDVAMADWDDLFKAVKATLRHTAGEPRLRSLRKDADATGRIQISVLECVAALDQLHATVVHELGRRQHLEAEVFDAKSALAVALTELAGTQAGERHARHLASHDGLTALPNREFFLQRLDDALARSLPLRPGLAVLYLDLDGFKSINDLYGHPAGDTVLQIVAARLARAVRTGDFVSRLAGDEFACLFEDVPSRAQLSELACKLFVAVATPMKVGTHKLNIRPSIGIATCPAGGASGQILLENADTAMYHAKRNKTGYAFFDRQPPTWNRE